MLRLDNAQADRQMLQEKEKKKTQLTLNVRSWARGEVLKNAKMESWKSGSLRPAVEQKKTIYKNVNSNLHVQI